jgi:4-aminobutyrate--pyruvate transaminase
MTIPVEQSNSSWSRDIQFHLHQQTNASELEVNGPTIIASGEGCYVTDAQGNRLFEGMSGLWCAALGFSEPRLADAAYAQMRKLPYYQTFKGASNGPLIDLAEKLIAKAPEGLTKVTFQSSGSEANDAAFKMAWYYFNAKGQPEKKKILSRVGGYHGTSISAGSATGLPIMHKLFDLPLERFVKVQLPHFYKQGLPGETEEQYSVRCAAELEEVILREGPETVAAFIAEPVMASAGVVIPPKEYFDRIQEVLRRYGILMIADEVVCGFGRTGNYWGSQTYGIKPDILTCAKALTSAYFPMSATLVTDEIYQAIKENGDKVGVFAHGYTYGGHPVGAAVACEALTIYDEIDLVGRVRSLAPLFASRMAALGEHPLVGEARSVGLCGAIEIVADKESRAEFPSEANIAGKLVALIRANGAVLRPIGQAVAFAPPLISTEAEINALFDIVERSLAQLSAQI